MANVRPTTCLHTDRWIGNNAQSARSIGRDTDRKGTIAMPQSAHILRFSAKPDSTDQLVEVFERALPHILEDPTTVSWFVGRSEDDPTQFILSHAFESEEAREAHFQGPAATLIMTDGAPFFAADPTIENIKVLAAS